MEKKNQEDEAISENMNPGLMFIEELNKQFGESSKTKTDFIEIILQYGNAQITLPEVIEKVQILFQGNTALLTAFGSFLPERTQVADQHSNQFQDSEMEFAQHYVQRILSRFPTNGRETYREFVGLLTKQLHGMIDLHTVFQEAQRLFYGHPDLYNDFAYFIHPNNHNKTRMIIENSSMYSVPVVPSVQQYPPIPVYSQIIPRQQYIPPPAASISLFSQPIASEQPKPILSRASQEYSSDCWSKQHDTKESAFDLNSFEFVKREGGEMRYSIFLRICHLLAEEMISIAEYIELIDPLYHDSTAILATIHELLKHHGIPPEFITKAPTALLPDQVKKLRRCTPSYHLLPSEYLHRGGSQRSYLEGRLLNDHWISCTIGSEDFNSGISHRNTYAEAMFKVEDDRFEADVLIETNRHCIGQLEVLLKELQEQKESDYQLVESSLSAVDKRAIRRLYSEYGLDKLVMDSLFKTPRTTIPLLIKRLKEKEDEWMREKSLLERKWTQVQEENYCKSLDIRSYTFKTQDKKNVTVKAFIDSIKAIAVQQVADFPPSQYIQAKQNGFDTMECHLSYVMNRLPIHKAVLKLLLAGSKRNLPYSDLKRFKTMLAYLICRIFGLEEEVIEDCENKNAMYIQNHDYLDEDLIINQEVIHDNQEFTFFCNHSLYVFYRFYQLLYSRLNEVADLCETASKHLNEFQISHTVKREAHMSSDPPPISPSERFNRMINHIILLIRNDEDSVGFEEASRQLVGAGGYILYTADKVISSCFKHIHSLFTENINNEIIASFALYEQKKNAMDVSSYRNHVVKLLMNYRLPIYKVYVVNGETKLWLVGNSHEIHQNGQILAPPEEFSKFSKDFLSVQTPSVKSLRNDPSYLDSPDEYREGGQDDDSDEGYVDVKRRTTHSVKRSSNRRRHHEDAEWNDF